MEDLDEQARRKLAAVAPVLEAVGRAPVYAIKVIDVPEAFVGLHARTVLLISLPGARARLGQTSCERWWPTKRATRTSTPSTSAPWLRAIAAACRISSSSATSLRWSRSAPSGKRRGRFPRGSTNSRGSTTFVSAARSTHPDYPTSLLRRSVVLGLEQRIARAAGR